MTNSTTITIGPAEQQQTTSGADGLAESREKSPDQTFSTPNSHRADSSSDKKPLWRLILTTVALLTGVFLVALDINILGPSLPVLRTQRNSSMDRQIDTSAIQQLRLQKSRPSFKAWKMQPGTQHRTTWLNWLRNQRLVGCIHLSPSNGHSVAALWYSSLVSKQELNFFPCIFSMFSPGGVLINESRIHHLCRCTKLFRPHIRTSHSRLFDSGSFHRRSGYRWLCRL